VIGEIKDIHIGKIPNPNTTKSKINPKSQISIFVLDFEIGIYFVIFGF